MPITNVNRLLIANVTRTQSGGLIEKLTADGFYVTKVNSSGGILYEATVTLLIGFDAAYLQRLLGHFRECCHVQRRYVPAQVESPMSEVQAMMIETEVGGATIYVLDVERFEQL